MSQSSSQEQIIPIDKQLIDFKNHLSYNDRIIFSAKFGDGKTFFLKKFFEINKEDYEVIQIFPVNYQVENNKDVFQLMKKDILIHLLANHLILDEVIIDKSFTKNYFLSNGTNIALDLLSVIPQINVPVSLFQKTLGHIKKFNEEAQQAKKLDSEIADEFIKNFSTESSICDNDYITEIIIRCIKKIKEKSKDKKVVLVIEDLDRIDPAHLFRIMNILTAHIDRNNNIDIESSIEKFNNKFNFDKIITVFDCKNTEIIFHHFYGMEANFQGYIDKFISSEPFIYSLKQVAIDYCFKSLSEMFNIPKELFAKHIGLFKFNELSIRNIIKLIEIPDNEIIVKKIKVLDDKNEISTINTFTKFLVVLKRLKISFVDIAFPLFDLNKNVFMDTIGVFWFIGLAKIGTKSIQLNAGANKQYSYSFELKLNDNTINSVKFQNLEGYFLEYKMVKENALNIERSLQKYIKE